MLLRPADRRRPVAGAGRQAHRVGLLARARQGVDWAAERDAFAERDGDAGSRRFARAFATASSPGTCSAPGDLERRNANLVGGDVGGGSYAARPAHPAPGAVAGSRSHAGAGPVSRQRLGVPGRRGARHAGSRRRKAALADGGLCRGRSRSTVRSTGRRCGGWSGRPRRAWPERRRHGDDAASARRRRDGRGDGRRLDGAGPALPALLRPRADPRKDDLRRQRADDGARRHLHDRRGDARRPRPRRSRHGRAERVPGGDAARVHRHRRGADRPAVESFTSGVDIGQRGRDRDLHPGAAAGRAEREVVCGGPTPRSARSSARPTGPGTRTSQGRTAARPALGGPRSRPRYPLPANGAPTTSGRMFARRPAGSR